MTPFNKSRSYDDEILTIVIGCLVTVMYLEFSRGPLHQPIKILNSCNLISSIIFGYKKAVKVDQERIREGKKGRKSAF